MNFRWNESQVRVVQNTKLLAAPVRTQGAEAGSSLAPAILARNLNFRQYFRFRRRVIPSLWSSAMRCLSWLDKQ
jgi:hypothetical protein